MTVWSSSGRAEGLDEERKEHLIPEEAGLWLCCPRGSRSVGHTLCL